MFRLPIGSASPQATLLPLPPKVCAQRVAVHHDVFGMCRLGHDDRQQDCATV